MNEPAIVATQHRATCTTGDDDKNTADQVADLAIRDEERVTEPASVSQLRSSVVAATGERR
jgi:hypothetical protein